MRQESNSSELALKVSLSVGIEVAIEFERAQANAEPHAKAPQYSESAAGLARDIRRMVSPASASRRN